jgi:menaquinone-specific isochorismate synthase
MLSTLNSIANPPRPKDLYPFLAGVQQIARHQERRQIASLAFAIPAVDPLLFLGRFAQTQHRSFYWERCDRQEAIAALGVATAPPSWSLVSGCNQFSQAQQFVQQTLARLHRWQELPQPFAGPHFCCGFPFFEPTAPSTIPFGEPTIFLPQWQVARAQDQGVLVTHWEVDADTELLPLCRTIVGRVLAVSGEATPTAEPLRSPPPAAASPPAEAARRSPWLAKLLPFARPARSPEHPWEPVQVQDAYAPEYFIHAAEAALQAIGDRHLEKVVLAHAVDVVAATPLHPFTLVRHLRRRYPNCYVFALGDGQGRSFVGASPECLARVERRGGLPLIVTEALAGSAPRGDTLARDRHQGQALLANPKERREHQVVVEAIMQCLHQLGAILPPPPPPGLRKLANIQHLHTPITGTLPPQVDILAAIAALHPTPAVAGMPRNVAAEAIAHAEPFARGLYAAPLGWLDGAGNGEFAVGIRSALIEGDRARLYAGAGIVAGSDPHRELAEVRLKLQALLAAWG